MYWADRDKPDVIACEFYIKSKLVDPGDYRREGVKRDDTDLLNVNNFYKLAGKPSSTIGVPELERAWRIIDEGAARRGELQLRLLEISYSRWGGDTPQTKVCAFRLTNGKLQSLDTLMENAEGNLTKAVEGLAILKGDSRPPRPKYACCL